MPHKDPSQGRAWRRRWLRAWRAERRATWLASRSCDRCGAHAGLEVKAPDNVWSWSEERRERLLAGRSILCASCRPSPLIAEELAPVPSGPLSKKRCDECGRKKALTEFNRLSRSRDGRQSRCRECFSRYNKKRHVRIAAEVRERARLWAKAHPERIRAAKRQWKKTKAGKAATARYKPSPYKQKARQALNYAVLAGLVQRGECAQKGPKCAGAIHGHHHLGYAKKHWLDVIWLCQRHHEAEHNSNGQNVPT